MHASVSWSPSDTPCESLSCLTDLKWQWRSASKEKRSHSSRLSDPSFAYLGKSCKLIQWDNISSLKSQSFVQGGLQPGQQVKGKVVMADSKGLLVNIDKDLNAFVPNEHISDLGERQGKAKYKIGAPITGKVLTVDPVRKRATLTLKQALVTSKLKPLTSWEVSYFTSSHLHDAKCLYSSTLLDLSCLEFWPKNYCGSRIRSNAQERLQEVQAGSLRFFLSSFLFGMLSEEEHEAWLRCLLQDVKVGAKAQGVVTGSTTYGCFVRFFGDVKGLIHFSELGLAPGKKPADAFEVGQVNDQCAQTALSQQKWASFLAQGCECSIWKDFHARVMAMRNKGKASVWIAGSLSIGKAIQNNFWRVSCCLESQSTYSLLMQVIKDSHSGIWSCNQTSAAHPGTQKDCRPPEGEWESSCCRL